MWVHRQTHSVAQQQCLFQIICVQNGGVWMCFGTPSVAQRQCLFDRPHPLSHRAAPAGGFISLGARRSADLNQYLSFLKIEMSIESIYLKMANLGRIFGINLLFSPIS